MARRQAERFRLTALLTTALLLLLLVLVITAGWSYKPSIASQEGLGSWTQMVIPGLDNGNRVYAVRRANNLLLAGTQSQGIFRSTNGGTGWDQVPQYSQSYVRDLLLVGVGGQTALATTWGDGLIRSTDNGTTWSQVGQNINTDYFYSLASKSGTVYAGTATIGIWKSTNNGETWNSTASINSPGAVSIAAATDQIVYAGSVNNGLYKTTNGGSTWNQIGFAGKTVRAVTLDPGNTNQVYASVIGEGVKRSINGGGIWQSLDAGLPDANVLSLLVTYVSGTRQVLAGTPANGVYRLDSDTWSAWGLQGKEVYSLSDWNDRVYAGTNQGVWENTFSPTPTPGLKLFHLSNDPITVIEPGQIITYSITIRNGQQPLTSFEVTNPIPVGVSIITQQATPGPTVSANKITWVIGSLSADATRVLSYKASRPTGTPTVTAIVNTGAIGSGKFAGIPIPTTVSNGVTNPSRQFYVPLIIRRS